MSEASAEPEQPRETAAGASRRRCRRGDAVNSFRITIASHNLRRAQASFAFAWTGEWTAFAGPIASRAATERLVSHRLDLVAHANGRATPVDSDEAAEQDW